MKTITENEYNNLSPKERLDFTGIVKYLDGTITYIKNGRYHREDGPAYIDKNGVKMWYYKGNLHNLNGSAVIWSNKREEYWANGQFLTENKEAFELYVDMLKLKNIGVNN